MRHSMTLYALCEAAYLGAGLACLGGIRPDRQASLLRAHTISHLWVTPSQLKLLTPHGKFPSLQFVLIGGGALDDADRDACKTSFPNARIVTFYGTSEASFITLDDMPYPGVEITVRNGEIYVRSALIFDGYVQGDDPNVSRDGDWLRVGDAGEIRADGSLHVAGRSGREVNIADQLVSPEPAERLLSRLAHATVVVVARPDARRGHTLLAYRVGSDNADLDSHLLRLCRERLGIHACPKAIRAIPTLPLLSSGKPDLSALAARASAEG